MKASVLLRTSCFWGVLTASKPGMYCILIVLLLALVPVTPLSAQDHVFGDQKIFHWAPTRTYHVENYKLAMHFDEPKGEIFGDETITLRPFASNFRSFYLNSTELAIDSVSLMSASGAAIKLAFATEDSHLWITLDRAYPAKRVLTIRIVYHGVPRTGLFFVNPTAAYPHWPQEVYSQGEPELNQFWFPCWDYPNDMARSETITTVPRGQVVVSNGKLVRVTRSGSSVTYDWVESVPHSSYLISIAVGPWHKYSDSYKGKPVDYYVPATVDEATARRSFRLTPDMIGFFSRATGVEYPYEQYAQTIVNNYMFGGQENVSATTLTDATLHDARADQDFPSTSLVSHELGQHWFGDFVQSRDWAHIWLNEGFATYMEALYTQFHEGNDAYRYAIYQDQLGEQQEEQSAYQRPVVDRHYNDPLEMFDATTHVKGAAVLDMLRYIIDGAGSTKSPASQREPLFQALHQYLMENREQAVDTSDVVAALRKHTGQELDWFFREWIFKPGHPKYSVEAKYDAARKIEHFAITQTQVISTGTPIFDMPIEVAFYGAHGERKTLQVRNNLQQQTFDIPLAFEPQWIDLDPNDFIDKELQFNQSSIAMIAAAEKDPSMMARLWAVQQLGAGTSTDADARVSALEKVLNTDPFYGVRAAAATSLGRFSTAGAKTVLSYGLKQPDSRVRAAVVKALGKASDEVSVYQSLVNALHNDSSYAVQAAAAREIGNSKAPTAYDVLSSEIQSKPEKHVMQALLISLAGTKDTRAFQILLDQAQPGIPEAIRLYALVALQKMKPQLAPKWLPQLTQTIHAALDDPYFPVQTAGEELVGVYGLTQFEPEIRRLAESAPLAMQRQPAQMVLHQLEHLK